MPRTREQPDREERILNEIIVDAYERFEQALAWYYYLQDNLQFPFMAQGRQKRSISPLKVRETMYDPKKVAKSVHAMATAP
jgi:hypothetical protein